MADVSKIKLPNGTTYDIKDTVSGYTKNTGTITKIQTTAGAHTTINVSSGAAAFNVPTKTSHLTNDSGFITNAGVTGVKGSAESSYRTGNVNLTAANLGAVGKNDELLTTNPFRPASLSGPYISKIDNAFYAADKRWNVSMTNLSAGRVDYLFDGSYETTAYITAGKTSVITMDFTSTTYFPGYPYGYILVSFYYTGIPASVSGRVYCNYSAHGVGWHNITFSPISDSSSSAMVYRSEHQGFYNISQLEITVVGNTDPTTKIAQIEMHLDRPDSSRTPFLSKYGPETLYYPLTAPSFIGNVTGNVSGSAGSVAWSGVGSKPTTLSGYGITDAKIASGTITLGSNTITPLTSSSTLNAAKLSGTIPSAVTATTQTAGDNSTKIATTAFVSSAISGLPTPMQFIGTVGTNGTTTWANLPAASGHNGHTYKVITAHTAETGKPAADVGDALISNGTEWIVIPAGDETATQSATTGISIAAHGTGTVIGVQSTTTTASKVTVGSSSTDYGVKSAGSASTWTFEEKTIPNVTAAGSGSASLTFTMDTTDTKKLKIAFSHTHTAPTLGTAIKVQSKSGGANSTAPTLGSKVPTVSASDVTVPIKNTSASTFVTGTTHTITDNGHTHTI